MPKEIFLPTAVVRKRTAVVPVSEGGTGASDPIEAAVNLQGIYAPYMNQAMYASKLDEDSHISRDQLPSFCVDKPTVYGPKELYTGQNTNYVITNFDTRTQYVVQVNTGAVVLNNDTLSYVAPNDPQQVTFHVNDKVFTVNVRLPWPLKPTLAASSSGSNSNAVVNLNSAPFQMVSGGATHISSDWQVATDVSFTNVLSSSLDNAVNKTTYSFTGLSLNTQYYFRVRYKSSNGEVSDWSNIVPVLTKIKYSPTSEERKLIASDRAANDNFGYSVAITADGSRVIIGAPNADESMSTNSGAVYVFRREGSTWIQEAILNQAASLVNNVYFGFSVAIDDNGDRIVIGAYGANSSRGYVYVYSRSVTTWTLEVLLQSTVATNDDRLGISVACNADCSWIVAGAVRNTSGSVRSGTAYTFRRSGTIWYEETKLIQSDPQVDDYFGYSVALNQDGTRAVVGAPLEDPSGLTTAGSAYVYVRSGNTWSQEAKLVASDASANSQFGLSVDMDNAGSKIIVSANIATVGAISTSGAAYVFNRSGSSWTQEVKLISSDLATNDRFGSCVAMTGDGTKVVIGASGKGSGVAYIFNKIGFDWFEEIKISASDAEAGDTFGLALDISRDAGRLIVGAQTEDANGTADSGSCYIFA